MGVNGLRFCPPLSVQRKCPHAGDADIEPEGADTITDTEPCGGRGTENGRGGGDDGVVIAAGEAAAEGVSD
ncbi:MAG: hypothetical protein U9N08_08420 [Candidatus Caldatribacteriota bacterium]|nr:hypothetical protein [Candidatus Caldatribacteriota bacterium]